MNSGGVGQNRENAVPARYKPADAIIIGGGISGLSLAFRLLQRRPDWQILILEAASRPGGTIWTEYEQDFVLEYGPNGFLANKTSTLQLLHDLGLETELLPADKAARHRYVFDGRRLHRLPRGPISLLGFQLLPWRSKWAILTERWCRRPPPEKEESVYDFIARRTDNITAELFGDLLVTGIFAGDARQLSMNACFPRIVAAERQAGSVTAGVLQEARQRKQLVRRGSPSIIRSSGLCSLKHGLRQLIESLASKLAPTLRLNSPVRALCSIVEQNGRLWQVVTDSAIYLGRHLVLTCPAYVQAELLRNIDPDLAECVAAIPYVAIAVIGLGYRREQIGRWVTGFGYLTTVKSRSSMLGAQWCSSIFPSRAPSPCILIRYMAGGVRLSRVLDYSDEELIHRAHTEAAHILQIQGRPVYSRVIRWPRAIPQYVLGHLDRLNKIKALLKRHSGLYLAGNAYHGVSLNDCTEQAELLTAQILNAKVADYGSVY